jgi:hypothetical protein
MAEAGLGRAPLSDAGWTRRQPGGGRVEPTFVMEIIALESVPGFIVFDLPWVRFSAGGRVWRRM